MKKTILLAVAVLVAGTTIFAQGGFQRRTVEERVKDVMEKMKVLNLEKDASTKVDTIFTDFYKAQDKAFEDMRNSGGFDRDAMMAKRKELADARDEKLKKVLSDDQFKKFKDEIEPSMRPQRQGGGNR